jgi:signal transduction histidine kinase
VTRVAEEIRSSKQAIIDAWTASVLADLRDLTRLERGALIDHLPEVLDGLAAWVEGRTELADLAFSALADGHALQRLGFGIELAAVCIEYGHLRQVLLARLLELEGTTEVRRDLARLNAGLDRAVALSIRRYTERRDHLRERFISILGHDLSNPLAAVALATESLLGSQTLGDRERRAALTIERSSGRMQRLVRDVLDFARGHLGDGIPVAPALCDLNELCETAVAEARAAHPRRTIELATAGDLRAAVDPERFIQVLANLLANAVTHGEDPVRLEVRETEDRHAVITRVSNRGTPVPRKTLHQIFEPFVHASERPSPGLGLGLYIVSQIARSHGALIEVASSPDETSFTIRWPRSPLAEAPRRT